MNYIGLLTDKQKRAGYFVTQDGELVFLWHRRNGNPDCLAIFFYDHPKLRKSMAGVVGKDRRRRQLCQ